MGSRGPLAKSNVCDYHVSVFNFATKLASSGSVWPANAAAVYKARRQMCVNVKEGRSAFERL